MPRTIERCRRIIDALDEGICSIDAEGRTSFVNPRLTEMSGFRAEEILGRPVFDLVDEHWHPTVREALENTRRGIRGQYELKLCRKDKTKVWISLIASPLYDRGSYAGGVALIEDISARKQTEQALRLSEERFRLASPRPVRDYGTGMLSPIELTWGRSTCA
jgi:PAS domain S-box-containing protein